MQGPKRLKPAPPPVDPVVPLGWEDAVPTECDLWGGPVPPATPMTREQQQDSCEEAIRHRAYCLWEQAGCPSGDGFDFWLAAQQEILSQKFTADLDQA